MMTVVHRAAGMMAMLTMLAQGIYPPMARASEPLIFQSEGKVLAEARRRAETGDAATAVLVKRLCEQADHALTAGPWAVTDKRLAVPSGDPHEYVSLAPYFWPNPQTPDHLPYVRRDGRRNPEIRGYDASRFGAMSGSSYILALSYYLTADERYAERAALLLRTWFIAPATRMNPNLDFAQLVKGVNHGRGTGIIESARLLNVVDAIGLLRGSKAWTSDDQKAMESWFSQYLNWMLTSRNGREEAAATNNHGAWYDVQVVTYCLFLRDEPQARRVLEAAKSRRLAAQIQPDGRMPRELSRTNALGYSVFNLEALTELADLGTRAGVDLWTYKTRDGRSIRTALDWLLPYALGEKHWPYQQISTFNPGSLLVPLCRAARALPDPMYQRALDQLKARERAGAADALRFAIHE